MTDHPSALVSVPREPTPEMLVAMSANSEYLPEIDGVDLIGIWRAALSAAPAAPQAAGVGEDDGARLLWNRFAVAHHESWDDEPNKAEYRQAAADVLALRAPSREPEGGAVRDALALAVSWIEELPRKNASHAMRDDVLAEIKAALATREESPAEAGEPKYFAAFMAEDGALRAQPQAREDAQPVWVAGIPTKHHAKEWFIAETTAGDRVVLTALPEEYAYDFKTADETYIKADRIKRWMPFPDSQYLFPHPSPDALRVAVEALEWAIAEIKGDTRCASEDQRQAALEKAQSTLASLQAEQGAK